MHSIFSLIFKSRLLFHSLYILFFLPLLLQAYFVVVFLIIIWLPFKFKTINDGISLILEGDFEVSLGGGRLLTCQLEGGVDA
jgi:hypothetical protein